MLPAASAGYGVRPGDRIRMSSADLSGDFLVEDVRPEALVLSLDSASEGLRVPTTSLIALDIHRGRQTSLLRGLVGGAFFGGLAGAALAVQCSQRHFNCATGLDKASNVLVGVSVGALIGLVLSRRSDEVWQQVLVPRPLAAAAATEEGLVAKPLGLVPDLASDEVELIVRNQTDSPITAYALWERGRRVPLGEVGPRSARSFATEHQGPRVTLTVDRLAGPGPGLTPATPDPSEYALVSPRDRLEWTVRVGALRPEYVRLPRR